MHEHHVHVHVFDFFRSITQFSDFIREVASCQPTCQNMLPEDGLVFDYYLNLKTYCFNPWTDKKQEKTSVNNHYVSVPEVCEESSDQLHQYAIDYAFTCTCIRHMHMYMYTPTEL